MKADQARPTVITLGDLGICAIFVAA